MRSGSACDERARAPAHLARAADGQDPAARARAWEVLQAAYREREPAPRSRPRVRPVVLLAVLTLVAGVAVAAAATPHSGVGVSCATFSASASRTRAPHWCACRVAAACSSRAGTARGSSSRAARAGDSGPTTARRGRRGGCSWSPGVVGSSPRPSRPAGFTVAVAPRADRGRSLEPRRRLSRRVPRRRIAAGGGWRRVRRPRFGAAGRASRRRGAPDNAHVLAYVDARQRVTCRRSTPPAPVAKRPGPRCARALLVAEWAPVARGRARSPAVYDAAGRVLARAAAGRPAIRRVVAARICRRRRPPRRPAGGERAAPAGRRSRPAWPRAVHRAGTVRRAVVGAGRPVATAAMAERGAVALPGRSWRGSSRRCGEHRGAVRTGCAAAGVPARRAALLSLRDPAGLAPRI